MRGEPIRPQAKPVPRPKEPKRLSRRTRLKARGKTSHARRHRDAAYMGKVAQLACLARLLNVQGNDCDGAVQVHHAFGRRVVDADRKTIPLCRKHHIEDWHEHRGVFAGWDRERRQHWSTWAIEYTRLELGEP